MQHSDAPWNALKRARDAVDSMKAKKHPAERAECWQDFLVHLERVWNKAHAHFSKSPKWSGWRSPYEHLRKTDPLLSYLRHARNADEHTANPISTKTPGGLAINPARGTSLNIHRMEMKGGRVMLKTDAPVRFQIAGGEAVPIPVIDSGVEYLLPTHHRDKPIEPKFVEMAELAIAFYEDALTKAEAFFVK
ncbi:hypothetical protein [Paraburkholderia sp. RL17-373-BIF-A]|uniref:hypothetical protein n=1 Tax=Paraburkholderia sp. RL17-373-BIF-A TaxID=3031629 RepID=UPI0038B86057